MRAHPFPTALAVLVLSTLLAACNDVPVATQCEGFTLQVAETQTSREPVKLDFLWVVDDSTSMCQEQAALAESIQQFIDVLQDYLNVDIRTAVVTTAALIPAKAGRFNVNHATEFPPLCQEERLFPARSDLHCECAACVGWEAAFADQCGQDTNNAGQPRCPASPYQAYRNCLARGGCSADLYVSDRPADDVARLAGLAGLWVWEPPIGGLESTYNLNNSVNSTCQLRCGEGQPTVSQARERGTEICRDWFLDTTMICQVPDLTNTGCIKPPQTADCPADLPGVLPAYNEDGSIKYGLEYFRCIATVGADQSTAANLEQGMKQAWLALDDNGPHPLQICDPNDPVLNDDSKSVAQKRAECERVFLRQNAFLIIVFVTDEDDCSVADDKRIIAEDYNRCALLGDVDTAPEVSPGESRSDPRPLAPVFQYANRLRSLKQNPANVFVAAITGDAWKTPPTASDAVNGALTAQEVEDARALYFDSKTERTNRLALNTSICASAFGRSDLGLRYIRLIEQFGPHGFRANICSDQGIGPSLAKIAEELISEVLYICLPRPVRQVEGQEMVNVYKTPLDGDRASLDQGTQFAIGDEPELGACPGSGRAIRFDANVLPLPNDKIEILYEAEADCGF
jgi:hypothetical protein